MPDLVYLLSAVTSIICMVLLIRGYWKTRTRLLLWSSVGFAGLAINNVLLVLDLVVFPHYDLRLWRDVALLTGLLPMALGLILDS